MSTTRTTVAFSTGDDARDLRARDCDQAQREACESERSDRELTPRSEGPRNLTEDVEVREAHGVPGPPPPGEQVAPDDRRKQHEREERQRALEAQSVLRSETPIVPLATSRDDTRRRRLRP